MKNLVKALLVSPFQLLNRIDWAGESLFWRIVDTVLTDQAKFGLSKQVLLRLMSDRNPENKFKIIAFINAIGDNSPLASRFARNLLEGLRSYPAQLGQDCLVDTIFEGKRGGIFVEIGVGDGRTISNTYFLEKHRGWTGVLCEPAVKFQDSIRRSRAAELVTEAIYSETGHQLNFSEVTGNEELSTLSDRVSCDFHDRSNSHEYPVTTLSFTDLYKRHLAGNKIDYLSVDTEGSEMEILGNIDLSSISVSVISVEHSYDKAKLRAVSDCLGSFGYTEILHGLFEFDAIFVDRNTADLLRQNLGSSALGQIPGR